MADSIDPPNVCVLTTSYPRYESDEAVVFMRRMVDEFSRQGLKGYVVVPLDSAEAKQEVQSNFKILRFDYGFLSKGALAFGAGIVPNLKANPFLITQVPTLLFKMTLAAWRLRASIGVMHANWLPSALSAYLASLLTGKPYIVTLRGEDVRLFRQKVLRILFFPCLWRAKAIVTVSKTFLREMQSYVSTKIHWIPNGVSVPSLSKSEVEGFARENSLDPRAKYLLFVGTLIPRKKVEVLIRLLTCPGLKDFSLLLCGRQSAQDYFEGLQQLAINTNCRERVHFVGQVAPEHVPYYQELATCYITASEFEGRSNSLQEALALGKVAFASDIEAHREVIEHQHSGFLFNPADLDGTAALIRGVLSDLELCQEVSQRAKFAMREYTWERCGKQYRELFESCIKK